MTDDRFKEFLRAEARAYRPPPETPREEMWAAIERRVGESDRRLERGAAPRIRPWVWWSGAIAAALVLGVAIGRWAPEGSDAAPGETPAPVAAAEPGAYAVAAREHLAQVETFLTVFRLEARAGRADRQALAPASGLLSTTRLLLDSPAGQDARLRTLLEDVELVLAQIAHFSAERPVDELDLIDRGIRQRGVLLKLQALSGAAGGTQGVL
jgi:hypothetical protein